METRPETPAGQAYTVVSGDNLWKIARRFYGGSSWKKIYDANASVIEETAKNTEKHHLITAIGFIRAVS